MLMTVVMVMMVMIVKAAVRDLCKYVCMRGADGYGDASGGSGEGDGSGGDGDGSGGV